MLYGRGKKECELIVLSTLNCTFMVITITTVKQPKTKKKQNKTRIIYTCAGQAASHSLQAIHRSSPDGYLLRACSPLNRGLSGPFSNG